MAVPADGRSAWLSDWHSESEWLNATHKTIYSNAIIGLNEQIVRHAIPADESTSDDDQLIYRFRQRQRHLTEPDILIVANDHWDFDVRGFNPGGNHGSFFRVSTNSTFMIAGGPDTGVPRGLAVETPYDGMSFVPTLLRLMGKIDSENRPVPELYERGIPEIPRPRRARGHYEVGFSRVWPAAARRRSTAQKSITTPIRLPHRLAPRRTSARATPTPGTLP